MNAIMTRDRCAGRVFMYVFAAAVIASGCMPGNAEQGNDSRGRDVVKSDEEWRKELTAEQYQVLRNKGTERPGTGKFYHHKEDGVYVCGGCGQPLFASEDKYDSGCGWPSFSRPAAGGAVEEIKDRSLGMLRTEIVCSSCAGHLGHVFEDGPKPTGLRYCINSASLGFKKQEAGKGGGTEKATFAAGCFWCVEAVFETQDGVKGVISGYTGGRSKDPTYEQVCGGQTGHAEAVQVEFDPSVISYEKLLDLFWKSHNPTTPNRQGADVGSQYRSAVFYHSPEQKEAAERKMAELVKDGVFADPIVTELAPAAEFYEAEEYHQDYFRRNTEAPYCNAVIGPKLKKLGL